METKRAITFVVMVTIFASFATGCTMGPAEITDVVICKSVDSDSKPVNPATVFPLGTNVIYASVKVNNMSTEDKITVKWNYLETGEEIHTIDITTEEPGPGYKSAGLTIEGSFPAGKYNVIVYLNGEDVKTTEFSVE
jgi:hypothetical protein